MQDHILASWAFFKPRSWRVWMAWLWTAASPNKPVSVALPDSNGEVLTEGCVQRPEHIIGKRIGTRSMRKRYNRASLLSFTVILQSSGPTRMPKFDLHLPPYILLPFANFRIILKSYHRQSANGAVNFGYNSQIGPLSIDIQDCLINPRETMTNPDMRKYAWLSTSKIGERREKSLNSVWPPGKLKFVIQEHIRGVIHASVKDQA